MTEWIKKQYPTIRCLQDIPFSFKDIHRLKAKEQEKIFHANVSQKGVRVIIFMAEKNRQSQKLSQETKKDIMQ